MHGNVLSDLLAIRPRLWSCLGGCLAALACWCLLSGHVFGKAGMILTGMINDVRGAEHIYRNTNSKYGIPNK